MAKKSATIWNQTVLAITQAKSDIFHSINLRLLAIIYVLKFEMYSLAPCGRGFLVLYFTFLVFSIFFLNFLKIYLRDRKKQVWISRMKLNLIDLNIEPINKAYIIIEYFR